MKSYTVAIVGLGPAGFAAAYELQERNENYIIITDSYRKECTGLFPFRTVDWFKKKGLEDIIEKSLLPPEELDLMIFIRKDNATLEDFRPKFVLNVDRIYPHYNFNKQLADLLNNKICARVENVRKYGNLFEIILDNGKRVFAKNVIWATGYRDNMIKRHAYQLYYENPGIKTAYFIIFDKMDFYIWIVPKGRYLIVGALENHLDRILEAVKVVEQKEKKKIHGTYLHKQVSKIFLPTSKHDIMFTKDGMLLVGESAGLVSRNYGEGVYPALVSGELAGKYFNNTSVYIKELEKSVVKFVIERLKKAKKLYYQCSMI